MQAGAPPTHGPCSARFLDMSSDFHVCQFRPSIAFHAPAPARSASQRSTFSPALQIAAEALPSQVGIRLVATGRSPMPADRPLLRCSAASAPPHRVVVRLTLPVAATLHPLRCRDWLSGRPDRHSVRGCPRSRFGLSADRFAPDVQRDATAPHFDTCIVAAFSASVVTHLLSKSSFSSLHAHSPRPFSILSYSSQSNRCHGRARRVLTSSLISFRRRDRGPDLCANCAPRSQPAADATDGGWERSPAGVGPLIAHCHRRLA
jgi:hypothetical protein